MVSQRINFGERSEPAPDRGGKLQSAGGAQRNISPLDGHILRSDHYRIYADGDMY